MEVILLMKIAVNPREKYILYVYEQNFVIGPRRGAA
jgi:hypothetical protein